MLDYKLILHGLEHGDRGLPGALVRDLLDALDEGARGAVRLRLEGRSKAAGGSPPAWVVEAAAFAIVDLLPQQGIISLRAPSLLEAVPRVFSQQELFPSVDSSDSALALMNRGLADALDGQADSDAYDEPLLGAFETFRRVFQFGVTSVELRNGKPDSRPVVVTPEGVRTVSRLKRQTPRPQRVRLAGRLDAIRYSDRAFTLVIETGEAIRGVLAEGDPRAIADRFGETTVISGIAHFRPSGALLRVEADHLETGSDLDLAVWSTKPQPLFAEMDARELHRPQGPRSGLNAIVGKWPGDETDDEIFALIEEIS